MSCYTKRRPKPILREKHLISMLNDCISYHTGKSCDIKDVWNKYLVPCIKVKCDMCGHKQLENNLYQSEEEYKDKEILYECDKCHDQCVKCKCLYSHLDYGGEICDNCAHWFCVDCLHSNYYCETLCHQCKYEDMTCVVNEVKQMKI